MDIHTALEISKEIRSLTRRAETFLYSRERILQDLIFVAEIYEKHADWIEAQMEKEAA